MATNTRFSVIRPSPITLLEGSLAFDRTGRAMIAAEPDAISIARTRSNPTQVGPDIDDAAGADVATSAAYIPKLAPGMPATSADNPCPGPSRRSCPGSKSRRAS